MKRIKRCVTAWTEGRATAAIAVRIAGLIAIVVLPGAWVAWLAWCFLRPRNRAAGSHVARSRTPSLAPAAMAHFSRQVLRRVL
jgi:hypothetical protein